MIITIDGPAGSGKSTVAEILAKELGFFHFNSGSLYRAVTAFILENNIDIEKLSNLNFDDLKIAVDYIDGSQHVFVNSVDYTNKLRQNEVSVMTPVVSKERKIREKIDICQRNFGKKHNIVIDGRDTGSFVFPNADVKFYLDCDLDIRAKRRFDEEIAKFSVLSPSSKSISKLTNNGSLSNESQISLEQIKKEIINRDETDKKKKIAPLIIPKNAIVIDSSFLTINEVVDEMKRHIKI